MKPSTLSSFGAAASFVAAAAAFSGGHVAGGSASIAVGCLMIANAAVLRKRGR